MKEVALAQRHTLEITHAVYRGGATHALPSATIGVFIASERPVSELLDAVAGMLARRFTQVEVRIVKATLRSGPFGSRLQLARVLATLDRWKRTGALAIADVEVVSGAACSLRAIFDRAAELTLAGPEARAVVRRDVAQTTCAFRVPARTLDVGTRAVIRGYHVTLTGIWATLRTNAVAGVFATDAVHTMPGRAFGISSAGGTLR